MKRRIFLGRVIGILSAIALPAFFRPARAFWTEAKLADLLEDSAAARTIGEVYLSQSDPGLTAPAVLSLLSEKLGPSLRRGKRTREEIGAIVTDRIRLDFAQGDCVKLDGWVLSRTEVYLCALAALQR
jgi:hypothetical protein